MKFLASEGRVAPRVLRRLFLVAAVPIIVGCQSAEPFRLTTANLDASQPHAEAPGLGGAGGAPDTGGGSGDPDGGSGGAFFGSGGTGGGGVGGSINPPSGGAGGAVDAGSASEVANGGGGDGTADGAADVVAEVAPMDLAPETNPYCQNTAWTAKASVTSNGATRPSNGIDGNLTTRWGTSDFQDGTDWYQVDFGGLVRLDSITLDNTQAYPSDYPGAYAVHGSTDGTTFTGPFATGNGTQGKTVISFPAQNVRAIKINQTGTSRSPYWWQIGELQIHCL